MKIPVLAKVNIDRVKQFLKKFPKILIGHIFLAFWGILFLASILGVLVFYKYSFLAGRIEPEILEKPFQFEEKAYRQVLEIWQERGQRFERTETKEYPDLFR
ncbi:hypothetical protein KKB68_01820 [Patescibacteria group bacterium]|nr:hypothetical protein [Patescibacteria group bacterium]